MQLEGANDYGIACELTREGDQSPPVHECWPAIAERHFRSERRATFLGQLARSDHRQMEESPPGPIASSSHYTQINTGMARDSCRHVNLRDVSANGCDLVRITRRSVVGSRSAGQKLVQKRERPHWWRRQSPFFTAPPHTPLPSPPLPKAPNLPSPHWRTSNARYAMPSCCRRPDADHPILSHPVTDAIIRC